MDRGTFGLLMRLSRSAGMAPYPWESNGHHQLTQILVTLYGIVLLTVTSVSLIISVPHEILTSKTPLKAFSFMKSSCDISIVIIIIIGGFKSLQRMARMTRIIKRLEQIELKFSCYQTNPDNREIRCHALNKYFVSFIIMGVVLRIIRSTHLYNSGISISIVVQYWVKQYLVVTLEMQLAAFAGRILIALEIVNENLQNILTQHSFSNKDTINEFPVKRIVAWEEAASSPRNTNSKLHYTDVTALNHNNAVEINEEEGTEYKIRRVATSYMNILDIVEEWNRADGLLMIMVLIYHMVYLVWSSFSVIEEMIASKNGIRLTTVLNTSVVASHALGLLLFIEPFHRTHVQVDRTQQLVQFLKIPNRENVPITNELELFTRLLLLQRIPYSPLDLVTMNRSLLLKIFSSLTTYLIISMTYGSSLNNSV